MKVLHVNTYDTGGAAIAAIRLHVSLLDEGVDSTLITLFKTRNDIPNHVHFPQKEMSIPPVRFWKRIINQLFGVETDPNKIWDTTFKFQVEFKKTLVDNFEYFSFNETLHRLEEWSRFEEFDVINLHWVADFINWPTFFTRTKNKRIVWTLHDFAPFTGGYHYPNGYTGYENKEENFPFLKDERFIDFASSQLEQKSIIFSENKVEIQVVVLSNWLSQCSQKSRLFKTFDHHLIPNSLNLEIFRPIDKKIARDILRLNQEATLLLFVSENVNNYRKGFDILLEAISNFNFNTELEIVTIGNPSDLHSLGFNVRNFGMIKSEILMFLIYSAVDCFVMPSREDNLPNVMLEALACGTPVVSFSNGGMVDVIKDGINGKIAFEQSPDALSAAILDTLKNSMQYDRQNISDDIKLNFNYKLQIERYLEVYKNKIV